MNIKMSDGTSLPLVEAEALVRARVQELAHDQDGKSLKQLLGYDEAALVGFVVHEYSEPLPLVLLYTHVYGLPKQEAPNA